MEPSKGPMLQAPANMAPHLKKINDSMIKHGNLVGVRQ
jgi:hypothetical protein